VETDHDHILGLGIEKIARPTMLTETSRTARSNHSDSQTESGIATPKSARGFGHGDTEAGKRRTIE
jgi:hypothetical protein